MTDTKEKKTEAKAAPAKEFAPSGAPIQTNDQVDPNEAAVDADPRAGTSEEQNRIDFNDPTLSGAEAVAKNLGLKAETKD